MSSLSRRVVVTVAALALAVGSHAADDKPQPPPPFKPLERNSLAAMTRGDSIFHTAYLNPAVEVGGTKARHISMTGAEGAGVFLSLDPNVGEISPYGEYRPITEIATRQIEVTLKPVPAKPNAPEGETRKLYAIDGEGIAGRLVLVIPGDAKGTPMLIVQDKDGKREAVHPLLITDFLRIKPCHPGCFPEGTTVLTPKGPRAIQTVQPGDEVLAISAEGKPVAAKVASRFCGQSELVEVETDAGKLVTTPKQPFAVAGGKVKSAGGLVAGDEVRRWDGAKAVAAKVRSVKPLADRAAVFNLVLEVPGTFVAGGYLVKSKPPAER
jgi:hypothetical protein